jgi:copper oxidase (laccase) domain-containing protein
VTTEPATALAVFTADCAPVALASPEGVVGVAHAGWRGLVAGVLARTVAEMRALGAGRVVAGLGPCVHPECYEFSPEDLAVAAAAVGGDVRARTSEGRPALDLPGGVRAALAAAGAELVLDVDRCTACSGELFSHRARGDRGRQAVVAWRA